jgi:RNA polymerase sigma factor (TIGR02999 family)
VPVNHEEITVLLRQWRGGDRDAESRIYELLMPELRAIAGRCLRHERKNHTLQRTELVNEIFLKLYKSKIDWQSHGHFLAIVTRMMRRFLIDYARAKPKAVLLSMDGLPEALMAGRTRLELAVAVDEQLDELEKQFPRRCGVVVLMSYLGLSAEETAERLDMSPRTVEREWHKAKKWLYQILTGKPCKAVQKTMNG